MGGEPVVLGGHAAPPDGAIDCAWTGDGLLVTGHWTEGRARVWAMPQGRLVREIDLGGRAWWKVGEDHLLADIELTPDSGES